MKKTLLIIVVLISTALYSQDNIVPSSTTTNMHRVSDYPEGAYYSFDDFKNKKVRPMVQLMRQYMRGDDEVAKDSIPNQIFFYRVKDTSKFNNVFAVSFEGNLYIQQRYLSKYALRGNKSQDGDNPNSYHRVIKDGKYLYLEGPFGNAWSKGLSYNMGAIGAVANLNRLKGIVFDFEKGGFDFFNNCDDFNDFLKENNSDEFVNCKLKEYNILTVRKLMDTLLNP